MFNFLSTYISQTSLKMSKFIATTVKIFLHNSLPAGFYLDVQQLKDKAS